MSTIAASCADCNSPLPESGICQECATALGLGERGTDRPTGALQIEGYSISKLLGEGGMGSVYLADDLALGRKVAIKVIRSTTNPGQLGERFVREARIMATIEDPNVVRLYSFGTTGDASYLVMEYVPGESLAGLLQRRGPLPIDEVCRIGIQACYGLRAAASKGIVHRDVKPGNILIDERQTVRVADFGLAKQKAVSSGDSALTVEGVVVGTPYYMPPEQAEGRELTSASDVYSLGLVMYELLTGVKPFTGETPLAVIARQLHEPLPKPKRKLDLASQRLLRFLKLMTAKKAADRPNFDDVIETLEKIILWQAHAGVQVSFSQFIIVVMYALGVGVSVTLTSDLSSEVGLAKPLLLALSAAAFGFAVAHTFPRAAFGGWGYSLRNRRQ